MTRRIGEGTDHLLQTRGVSLYRDWPVQLVRHPSRSSRTMGLFPLQQCNHVQLGRLSQRIQFSSINSRTRFVLCVACCGSFEIDIRKELVALIQTIQYWYSGFWASSQPVVCSLDMPMRSHIQFYFFFFFFFVGERDVSTLWSSLIKWGQLVSK